jgi:predicted 3-demethylubiquinone-9 3-methyltransferase (glyoxalase superfamily)
LGSWPTRISANYSNVLWLVDKFCVPWQTVPHVSVRAMSARWARLRITVHVAQR